MKTVFVYITARDAAEARKIAKGLVRKRLAACVNVLGPIQSLYRWKGKVRSDREVALIAKTRADRANAVIREAKALHSYETPAIVVLPVLKGHRPFLEWIARETR